MRKVKIVLAMLVLLGQFYFSALPASAADHPKTGHPENFKGSIISASAEMIGLLLADGRQVQIAMGPETRIKIPAKKGTSYADLQAGMRAIVQARRYADGSLVARQVHAHAPDLSVRHIVGTVQAYQPGQSITLAAQGGDPSTYRINAGTVILPAEQASSLVVGTYVTLVITTEEEAALGIVIHPRAP